MRRLIAALGLMLTASVATACALDPVDLVCPAIAHITNLDVEATDVRGATWVQLCYGEVCSPAPGTTGGESTRIGAFEHDGVWSFAFIDNAAPDTVTIRVTDAGGAVLQEGEHRIDWVHSTEPCGGPSTAERVVL